MSLDKSIKHNIDRRAFTLGLALASIFPWTHITLCGADAKGDLQRMSAALELFLVDIGTARTIGSRYLDLHPGEFDFEQIFSAVFGEWHNMSVNNMAKSFSIKREKELLNGQVVSIAGWLFSETEARICALAALQQR